MIKHLVLFGACLTSLGPAFACNIASDTDRAEIASYVHDGLDCLAHPPAGFRFDSAIETTFIDKINAERRKRDLPSLIVRDQLLNAARFQSLDMGVSKFFDHQSPDGRSSDQRISAFDRTLLAKSTGENIAAFALDNCYDEMDRIISCFDIPGFKFPTPAFVAEDLHKKLMQSEGHRANILSDSFTHLSVGVARTDTGFYVTQLFAMPVGELAAPLPTEYQTLESLHIRPDIGDWDLGGYATIDVSGTMTDLTGAKLRTISPGEHTLVIIGEKKSEETRGLKTVIQTDWQHMRGPSFTLRDAKGS